MDLKIKLTKCNACDECKVTVQDESTYLPEDSTGTVKGKFKFSETVSIDILSLNKTSDTVYVNTVYSMHSIKENSTIEITSDGWFSLIHVVLPSIEWFNKEKAKSEGSALGLYNIVYYTDGKQIYKYIDDTSKVVTIAEIVEVNPINTTISVVSEDFISICYLRKCYINLCNQIFQNRGFSSCWKDNKIDSEMVYKRDLVWMALNVIKYLTECEQLAEVERIIETINGCNGLCSSSSTKNSNGCGCSK